MKIIKIFLITIFLSSGAFAGSDGEIKLSKKAKPAKDCFEKVNENCNAITENNTMANEPEGGFPQGKNLRVMPSSYGAIPNIVKQVFESKTVNKVIDEYYGQSCKRFLQVFASWEKRVVTNENLGRHSWLHADPYAALKFAFFPFGATKDNGAPMVVPKSRAEGKIIREQSRTFEKSQ